MVAWIALLATNAAASPSIEEALIATAARALPAVAHVEVAPGPVWTPALQEVLADFGIPHPVGEDGDERATGSAFVISPDGRALTNHHVVAGASEVTVVFVDQRRYPATVVGGDARTDVAVLQIQADRPLPFLRLGDASRLRVGQIVLAVGSPFDFSSTATIGIVSHLGRRGLDPREIQDYIQTDAAVNPGNSGGPLLALSGEVVGINTAIYAASGEQNAGISFAIPSNMARRVAEDLARDGRVRRSAIGLEVDDVDAVGGDPSRRGARVAWVTPLSPAAAAGLRRGDVIVGAGGEPIAGADALRDLVRSRPIADHLPLVVVRGGAELRVEVVVADARAIGRGLSDVPEGATAWAGARLLDAPPEIEATLGVAPGDGPLVVAVEAGSPAAAMGVLAGDRVVSLRGRAVRTVSELQAFLEAAAGSPSVVGLRRGSDVVTTILPGR